MAMIWPSSTSAWLLLRLVRLSKSKRSLCRCSNWRRQPWGVPQCLGCSQGGRTPLGSIIQYDLAWADCGVDERTQCRDGEDNDNDNLFDTDDPDCSSPTDLSEDPNTDFNACNDGVDNDSDGLIDSADGGCAVGDGLQEANCGYAISFSRENGQFYTMRIYEQSLEVQEGTVGTLIAGSAVNDNISASKLMMNRWNYAYGLLTSNTCPATCPVGQTLCGDTCVDLNNDNNHCGDCDVICNTTLSQVCDGTGQCSTACVEPYQLCGTQCVDVNTDANHCGECDNACTGVEVCNGQGSCAQNCVAGMENCHGVCSNLLDSPSGEHILFSAQAAQRVSLKSSLSLQKVADLTNPIDMTLAGEEIVVAWAEEPTTELDPYGVRLTVYNLVTDLGFTARTSILVPTDGPVKAIHMRSTCPNKIIMVVETDDGETGSHLRVVTVVTDLPEGSATLPYEWADFVTEGTHPVITFDEDEFGWGGLLPTIPDTNVVLGTPVAPSANQVICDSPNK